MIEASNIPYTSGAWLVKQGNEEAFIAAWTELAVWTSENVIGAGKPFLIQDQSNPQHFISFGAWESLDAIKAWRELPGFKERIMKAATLCEQFQGKDYILRSTI